MTGRPAPLPTQRGPRGSLQLAPVFSEWLMGLPLGWVTEPAIWKGVKPTAARNMQLHALGNGVVPLQAAAAVDLILRRISLETAA